MFTTNRLRDILARNDLAQWTDLLLEESRPAVQITTQPLLDERLIPVGASKLGGSPDVPDDFIWPDWNGKPLTFLAQFRLPEVAPHETEHALPLRGMLYFFYDVDEQPWGYDPADEGRARVIYVPDDTLPLYRLPHPYMEGTYQDIRPLRPCAAHLIHQMMLPITERSLNTLEHKMSRLEHEHYGEVVFDEFIIQRPDVWHHLLGYPDEVRGDMQIECQLVTNGLYLGDESGYDDPRLAVLEPGAADWRLLLQLDTDEDLQLELGDAGRLFFWIRAADLKARDFSQCWTILQCF